MAMALINPIVAVGNSIFKPLSDSIMVPVTRHIDYMVSCKKYVRDMGFKMRDLDAARSGIEDRKNRNIRKHLYISSQVDDWLGKFENIKMEVDGFASDVGSCFNFKIRHKLGRKAFKIIEEIELLTREHSVLLNNWTTDPIPLGEVGPSTSTLVSTHHQDFESREKTFKEALQVLNPDHESHMIALCGMAGVGKTTMMQDLKKAVERERMFSFIVEAVIGEKTDPIAIQQAVADYFSINLNEQAKVARAQRLRKCFEGQSQGGKNKILVILDDVWELVDLNDIGLSPLPNQGVDFKLLLTSRNREVCSRMGVNAASIIDVKALTNPEAQELFRKIVKDSDDADMDSDFHEIGDEIVSKCHGLPIAIKIIARNLKGKCKEAWNDALSRLKHHDLDKILHQVFEMSYNNLEDETRSIFLLCGLYPEDSRIPVEDLLRYGWGLKLFQKVNTIKEARNRVNTCIEQLIHANFLNGSHCLTWVKMHDLVYSFVLSVISKNEHASVVRHGNMSEWPAKDTHESCKILSLTCDRTSDFPVEYFKYPNLKLLKLMHGDKLLMDAENFYGGMENLQVIAHERMDYLTSLRSLQCSTTLRTLCLDRCSLTLQYSIIGNLLNLEVLSFAHSNIQKLPSIIRNLKKLKLLDLTGCYNLCIDSGVLKNLVNLEELYMRVRNRDEEGIITDDPKAISFSNGSGNDLAECSKNLSVLEVELFENNSQPMSMSFEKLERFNISLRCFSKDMGESLLPFDNKLMLVTSKGELLGSRMNKLIAKTTVLYLQVSDMIDLEEIDVDVISLHPREQSLFSNIRFLSVSNCTELRYFFTLSVATTLSKLENLQISSCPNLETLIHINNRGSETITFLKLKHLMLRDLPKLTSLCHATNVIDLRHLEELELYNLPKITSIYPENKSAASSSNIYAVLNEEIEISMLRKIRVEGCDSLVNIFPTNPMSLLCYLEYLQVTYCNSIEFLFNLDLGCVGEIQGASSLRCITVRQLQKLKGIWRVKGVKNSNLMIHGFHALENLEIEDCRSFGNLFTPTNVSFDLGALKSISMIETIDKSEQAMVEVTEKISSVAISSQVLFEMEVEGDASSGEMGNNQQALLLPNLQYIMLLEVEEMRHVWKCNNWNKFFIRQQLPNSSFHSLTSIASPIAR